MNGLVRMLLEDGHLECLKYLHEKDVLGTNGLVLRCQKGHLECLKYLHEKGCPWDERTCSDAA
jgi:hypothetical protein